MYRLFEEAHTIFDHEIDIVRLLHYIRYIRHFTKNLVLSMPEKQRREFNKSMHQSYLMGVREKNTDSEIRPDN